jgi:hypothetical protein
MFATFKLGFHDYLRFQKFFVIPYLPLEKVKTLFKYLPVIYSEITNIHASEIIKPAVPTPIEFLPFCIIIVCFG